MSNDENKSFPAMKPEVYLTSDDLFRSPKSYAEVDVIVNKLYLQCLEKCSVVQGPKPYDDIAETACFFPITRIVLDQDEDILQKLSSVYSSMSGVGANLSMIIRGYSSGETELYLGVCGEDNRINSAYPKARSLYDSFIGNFPGCRDDQVDILSAEDTRVLMNRCFDSSYTAVAAASCIASLRDKESGKNAGFYQGLDKVIETLMGHNYSILVLASPLSVRDIESVRAELENLYLRLSAYAKIQLGLNWSDAKSVSRALSETLSESLNKTQSASLNVGQSHSNSTSSSVYGGESSGFQVFGVSSGYSDGSSVNNGESDGTSIGKAISEAIAKSKGKAIGHTDTNTDTSTVGQSIQITFENKALTDILSRIDDQLNRLHIGLGLGMFAAAAYVMAPTVSLARIGASTYKAVISGSDTNLEYSGLNVWTGVGYRKVLNHLRSFKHPCFYLNSTDSEGGQVNATPAVLNTSQELALLMGLPRNKLTGLPVRQSVCFERSITKMNPTKAMDNLFLGNIYYLDHEEKSSVYLNLDDLTMHCLITGTTGSGKSNTTYSLLESIESLRPQVHFMVIEPVKGDYKTVFGSRENVWVYCTNDSIAPLLKMNPFRFRSEVHVLEHIDRLISVFNVCWPMEAAMPSVLKRAIERAYQDAGWDLRHSSNEYNTNIFPTFRDVLNEVNQIMDESEYSAENKGNYKGALSNRIEELTTGLNSMMFVSNDLTDEELFERNVIIDLSRLGSSETKALLMGLLVIRLIEYRLSTRETLNAGLKHITVLEEAHNLLKRTNTDQSLDSANIAGKAVEMLSNSLAEMRSTGEGFIIVDQSPSLLDLSAIRNTNTKIVLRIPENSDRELVGNAMSLTQSQIMELSKLPTGVAAIYQNDWMGAVLARIPYYPVKEAMYTSPQPEEYRDDAKEIATSIARGQLNHWLSKYEPNQMDSICRMELSGCVKSVLFRYVRQNIKNRQLLLPEVTYVLFNTDAAMKRARTSNNVERLKSILVRELVPSVAQLTRDELDSLLFLLISAQYERDGAYKKVYDMFCQYMVDTSGVERWKTMISRGHK